MQKALILIFIPLLAIISLKWLPYPYVWMFGCASFFSFVKFRHGKKSRTVIWFNIGSTLLILAVFEIALEVINYNEKNGQPHIKKHQLYNVMKHPILGYVLKPDSKRRAWKSHNGKMIYDVTYTVDQNGLRISPSCPDSCKGSVLFFGCSLTYGEGVNDTETLPYQIGLMSHCLYQIYNFGVHGYGPQHMLALIETGKVSSIVDKVPNFAIYQAIYPSHVYRVAGLREWVRNGPKFILDSTGNAVRSGKFSDDDWDSSLWLLFRYQLAKSALCRRIINYRRPIGPDDEKLFVAVLLKAARILKQLYPKIKVDLLMWGALPPPLVVARLECANISVHSIDKILQDSGTQRCVLYIKHDGHPTPKANTLVAEYVFRKILDLGKTKQ